MQALIRDHPHISDTLEIGCAFGISSLYICESLSERANPTHTIIDPNQSSKWMSVGAHNLDRAGYDFYELLEMPSELALPQLLKAGRRFDFVFIDGWHTFDHVMLDVFYSTPLLRAGGILVIDDCTLASVGKAIMYVKQYPCYEIVGSVPDEHSSRKRRAARLLSAIVPERLGIFLLPARYYNQVYNQHTMVAFQKVAEDDRDWLWHAPF